MLLIRNRLWSELFYCCQHCILLWVFRFFKAKTVSPEAQWLTLIWRVAVYCLAKGSVTLTRENFEDFKILFCRDVVAFLRSREGFVIYLSIYLSIYSSNYLSIYLSINLRGGVSGADLMAAEGAFGTDFYDRSILRPNHRAYYRSGRPVIKIGPKGALGSHKIRSIHSAPSLGQGISIYLSR